MTAITPTVPGPATPVGPVGPLAGIATMVRREMWRTLRSVDALITAFALPVLVMTAFVVIFGGAIAGDRGDYVVPGVLVMCLGFGAATTAPAVAQDRTSGTIDRFRTLPIMASSVLWGHVLASTARNLATSVVVIGAAYAMGFRAGAGPAGWLALAGLAAALALTFSWLSATAGLILSVEASQSLSLVFLFLPYLSSGFVPIDTLPSWLHGFAEHQPFTPIIELVRRLAAGTSPSGVAGPALAWLGVVLVVSCTGGIMLFSRRSAR